MKLNRLVITVAITLVCFTGCNRTIQLDDKEYKNNYSSISISSNNKYEPQNEIKDESEYGWIDNSGTYNNYNDYRIMQDAQDYAVSGKLDSEVSSNMAGVGTLDKFNKALGIVSDNWKNNLKLFIVTDTEYIKHYSLLRDDNTIWDILYMKQSDSYFYEEAFTNDINEYMEYINSTFNNKLYTDGYKAYISAKITGDNVEILDAQDEMLSMEGMKDGE